MKKILRDFDLTPNKFPVSEETEGTLKKVYGQAIGNDGRWHPWEELSQQERDDWMQAMTEADRLHDYYKTHERPLTMTQKLLHHEQDNRVC